MTTSTTPDDAAVRMRQSALVLGVVLTTAYVWKYLVHRGRPAGDPTELTGWWQWFDQIRYRNGAQALAELRFDPDAHHYPYGYPLLGSPFVKLLPNHPFFVPDLVAVVAAGLLLHRIAARWLGPRESAALVLGIVVLAHRELTISLVPPWSTIPTHALTYAMIFVALARVPSTRKVLTLAALDGGVFLCRPFDAVLLAPMLVVTVLELPNLRARVQGAALGMAVLAIFPLVHGGLNMLTFGTPTSPYERFMAEHIGFFDYDLLFKAYVTYLDGNPVYRFSDRVLFERLPWLLLAVPGLVWVVRRERSRVLGAVIAAVASIVAYTGYNNMAPDSFYRFSLLHYTAWTLPLAGVCTWLGFRRAWRELPRRITIAGFVAPVAAVWFARIEETSVLVAEVDENGRVHATDEVLAGGYDMLVVRGVPFDDVQPIVVGTRELHGPRDFHTRRQLERLGPLEGYAVVFADPVEAGELALEGRRIRGQSIELRQLRWRFTWLPPMVHKWFGDRSWGVDSLATTLRAPAARFSTAVGEVDARSGTIRTTATAGVLQRGPGVELPRGTYEAAWTGTVAVADAIEVAAFVHGDDTPLAIETVELRTTARTRVIARLRFRVRSNGEAIDVALSVPAGADLVLHSVEIAQRR